MWSITAFSPQTTYPNRSSSFLSMPLVAVTRHPSFIGQRKGKVLSMFKKILALRTLMSCVSTIGKDAVRFHSFCTYHKVNCPNKQFSDIRTSGTCRSSNRNYIHSARDIFHTISCSCKKSCASVCRWRNTVLNCSFVCSRYQHRIKKIFPLSRNLPSAPFHCICTLFPGAVN